MGVISDFRLEENFIIGIWGGMTMGIKQEKKSRGR